LLRAANTSRVTFVIHGYQTVPDQQGTTAPVGAKQRQGSAPGV